MNEETVLNITLNALRSIYPAWRTSVKSQQELNALKEQWLIAFKENNIRTDIQINRALKKCRQDTKPFMPSVGQFIKWCKAPHASHQLFDNTKLLENNNKLSPQEVKALIKEKIKNY